MCAPGLGGWALVQTVPSHQAPDWEGSCGRQSEESQVHPQRHGPVGRRCRVLCPGEMRSHKNYPQITLRANSASKSPHDVEIARQTPSAVTVVTAQKPQAAARVCATFIFCLGALSWRKKQAAHSNANVNAAIFFLKPTQIKDPRVIALSRIIIKFGWITRLPPWEIAAVIGLYRQWSGFHRQSRCFLFGIIHSKLLALSLLTRTGLLRLILRPDCFS